MNDITPSRVALAVGCAEGIGWEAAERPAAEGKAAVVSYARQLAESRLLRPAAETFRAGVA